MRIFSTVDTLFTEATINSHLGPSPPGLTPYTNTIHCSVDKHFTRKLLLNDHLKNKHNFTVQKEWPIYKEGIGIYTYMYNIVYLWYREYPGGGGIPQVPYTVYPRE